MKYLRITSTLLFSLLILNACTNSEEKDLAGKKKKLAEYKTQLKELSGKVETLEKEIAKLDTAFKVEQKTKRISVDVLKKQDFRHFIEVQGNVDAPEDITALPQQPGVVTAIYVKVGDRVSKGQLLAVTETATAMESGIQALEAQLNLATTAYDKQKHLWEQNIGSEIQFLQSKTQKEALEKQIASQRSQLEMTKIKAPISGVVDAVNLRVGDMAIGSQLMPGIRIINSDKLSVKAKLSDTDFGKIRQNDRVTVEFPDVNKSVESNVTYVSKTIDPRSRTFVVEVSLNNAKNELAANMIAKLKINDATLKNVLLVPTNVIQKSEEGEYVLVTEMVKGIKTAKKKMITTGMEYEGQTVVTQGLDEGDTLITFGYSEVVDGQRIEY
jgi:RND family efflux transporter MFP subunit